MISTSKGGIYKNIPFWCWYHNKLFLTYFSLILCICWIFVIHPKCPYWPIGTVYFAGFYIYTKVYSLLLSLPTIPKYTACFSLPTTWWVNKNYTLIQMLAKYCWMNGNENNLAHLENTLFYIFWHQTCLVTCMPDCVWRNLRNW